MSKKLLEFCVTIKEVADIVNVSNGLVQALHMITSTLNMHCLSNQFLPWPQALTAEQKRHRVEIRVDFNTLKVDQPLCPG